MSDFDRILSKEFMAEVRSVVDAGEYPWLRDMLCYWRPSGDKATESPNPKHLRLAIRKDSINFYRAGQSIAKVDLDESGKLQAHIHLKYVFGRSAEEDYTTLNSTGILNPATRECVPYNGTANLDAWIMQANDYVEGEKEFVDLVVAQNPNVIDLEMALPKAGRALRMDLVALRPYKNKWQIVFWEAKLVKNKGARCQGSNNPKVCAQLDQYSEWLHGNNCELAKKAYKRTCQLLVTLHKYARRLNPNITELGAGIRALAAPDSSPLIASSADLRFSGPRFLVWKSEAADLDGGGLRYRKVARRRWVMGRGGSRTAPTVVAPPFRAAGLRDSELPAIRLRRTALPERRQAGSAESRSTEALRHFS